MLEPMAVQPPFAARINQPIDDQGFEDVQPIRALARGWQQRTPEIVQAELVPKQHRQPACAPLTRAAQSHAAQPDRNHVAWKRRRDAVFREQRDLLGPSAVAEDLDRPRPRRALAVVDLAEMQHMTLNHPPAPNAPVPHHRPTSMLLAVLPPNLAAQKPAQDSRPRPGRAIALVGTTAVFAPPASMKSKTCAQKTPQKSRLSTPVGDVGLVEANVATQRAAGSNQSCMKDTITSA